MDAPSGTAAPPRRVTASPFVDGARAITPLVVGIVPFGLAIGAAISRSGLPRLSAWTGSFLLLAGSAQLTMVHMLDTGAGAVATVAVALLINLRIAVYAAGLAPWFPATSRRRRLLLAIPLIDQLYITVIDDFTTVERDERSRRRFYAGAATHLCLAWTTAQAIGVVVGSGVPSWLGLESAAALALTGLLAVGVRNRPASWAAAVAAVAVIVWIRVAPTSALVVAIVLGIGAGNAAGWWERRS